MSLQAAKLSEKFSNGQYRGHYSKNISIPKDWVDLGKCVAVAYASNKEGSLKHYEHKFRTARLLCSADGKTLLISGGNINVTDWIRG